MTLVEGTKQTQKPKNRSTGRFLYGCLYSLLRTDTKLSANINARFLKKTTLLLLLLVVVVVVVGRGGLVVEEASIKVNRL
jgi:hypothetical protein